MLRLTDPASANQINLAGLIERGNDEHREAAAHALTGGPLQTGIQLKLTGLLRRGDQGQRDAAAHALGRFRP